MEAGASGFLVKDAPAERLANATRRAAAGERVVDPELAVATLADGQSPFMERERGVLEAGANGSPVSEIAACPHLSEGTVRNDTRRRSARPARATGPRRFGSPARRAGSDTNRRGRRGARRLVVADRYVV